jgi:hypothetical protein
VNVASGKKGLALGTRWPRKKTSAKALRGGKQKDGESGVGETKLKKKNLGEKVWSWRF